MNLQFVSITLTKKFNYLFRIQNYLLVVADRQFIYIRALFIVLVLFL